MENILRYGSKLYISIALFLIRNQIERKKPQLHCMRWHHKNHGKYLEVWLKTLHLNFPILIIRCGMFLCHGSISHLSPIDTRIGSKDDVAPLMIAQLIFPILHHHHILTLHRLLNNKLIK
jgi:hypothetical protein